MQVRNLGALAEVEMAWQSQHAPIMRTMRDTYRTTGPVNYWPTTTQLMRAQSILVLALATEMTVSISA